MPKRLLSVLCLVLFVATGSFGQEMKKEPANTDMKKDAPLKGACDGHPLPNHS